MLSLCLFLAAWPVAAQRAPEQTGPASGSQPADSTTKEILTDAAIIALIIAASVASYKAMGRPCACPDDLMRNGRRCGNNSAYVKPAGYKPLCNITDVSTAMISTYRSTQTVPALK